MKEYIIEPKYQKILFVTDIHFCFRGWYGVDNDSRMELLCKAVSKEYEENPFDAILCLGDSSFDFWKYETKGSYLNSPSVSNTANCVETVFKKFPLSPYMIPGNHEQYSEKKWEQITGFPRQYTVVYGDLVFLMMDTFAGNLDPADHNDGTYTGIDPVFLKEAMEKYPDKTLILCVHELDTEQESEEVKALIGGCDRFFCVFAGHTHQSNTRVLGKEWGKLPVFYCGEFSFSLGCRNDTAPNWGFRTADFSDGLNTKYQPCLQLALAKDWRKAGDCPRD